jgi:hypothetical protein
MTPTPELALVVALVALVGVALTAAATIYNARKRGAIDERLLRLKAELDQVNAREIAQVQAKHSERLKKLEFDRSQDSSDGERVRKIDSATFRKLLEFFDPQETIAFLRDHDFGGAFNRDYVSPLHNFVNVSSGPEHAFVSIELEHTRQPVVEAARTLSKLIGVKTFPTQGNLHSVLPSEYVNEMRPSWVTQNAAEINTAATKFVTSFEHLVKECRKKLG